MLAPRSGWFIWPWFLVSLILGIVSVLISSLIIYLLVGLMFAIGGFQLWFFRDPERRIVKDPQGIFAAADGTIRHIEKLAGEVLIAIRMSPFNVHINRFPVTGTVKEVIHHPGLHRNVYFADAIEKNERTLTVVSNQALSCEVLQLTGMYARRIETWCEPGDEVEQGSRMGIIRFGSQTNMRIKLHGDDKDLLVTCRLGDRVQAGLDRVVEII